MLKRKSSNFAHTYSNKILIYEPITLTKIMINILRLLLSYIYFKCNVLNCNHRMSQFSLMRSNTNTKNTMYIYKAM